MLQLLSMITENRRFGSNVGVRGFRVEYFPFRTLTAILQHSTRSQGIIKHEDQFQWILQTTTTLLHVNVSPMA